MDRFPRPSRHHGATLTQLITEAKRDRMFQACNRTRSETAEGPRTALILGAPILGLKRRFSQRQASAPRQPAAATPLVPTDHARLELADPRLHFHNLDRGFGDAPLPIR